MPNSELNEADELLTQSPTTISSVVDAVIITDSLKTSEIRYRRLFEAAQDGILILDAETAKVVDVNPFLMSLLGYQKEHFMGKELWEVGVFQDAEASKSAMRELQSVGRIRYEDLPLEREDGQAVPVEFVSNVYREGSQCVIQCNIRDITERKHLASELAKAKEDTESASRAKSEFLANMSHEIRTPVTAIQGFAEMMVVRDAEECRKIGCVSIIQRNATHLLELINEILDISKIEAGKMTVESIPCDLPALLTDIISVMRPRAAEKGLAFGVTFQGSIPRTIRTDPLRLRQILTNLLGNAIKFTEAGRIDLRITDAGAGGPIIMLSVDVIDTGIGILPVQLARLFLPFSQGDQSITRKFGGTGLGLTISRSFARLLNGDITVTSAEGGSTFTLTINAGKSAGVERFQSWTEATLPALLERKALASKSLSGRILLVEDGYDNQLLLNLQLTKAGAKVVLADNGLIGVDLATTQTFDLILMDMQMPVMDGYAATRELRRRGLTTPIIAITAHAMAEDRDKCLNSGCTAYLSKPIPVAMLLQTVSEQLVDNNSLMSQTSDVAAIEVSSSASDRIQSSLTDDPQMMKIISRFVAGLPVKVHNMVEFLASSDLIELGRVVHQLLGAAEGYGFASLTTPARTVEESIREGQPLAIITTEANALVALIRRIDGYDNSEATVEGKKLAH